MLRQEQVSGAVDIALTNPDDVACIQTIVQPEGRLGAGPAPALDHLTVERLVEAMSGHRTKPSDSLPCSRSKTRHYFTIHQRLGEKRSQRVRHRDHKRPRVDQDTLPKHDRMGNHMSHLLGRALYQQAGDRLYSASAKLELPPLHHSNRLSRRYTSGQQGHREALQELLVSLDKAKRYKVNIRLLWVTAHRGILGNKLASAAA
jgi:hypothetical protein